ncbi:MAG: aldo/keto reductase [Erysipelotrichaceae bacterium]
MQYTTLGNTDIKISKICAGCMSFGDNSTNFHDWTLDYQQSKAIIKEALAMGINFFDTANIYSAGTSEEFLGKALKELEVERSEVVIATKVYFNEGKLSAEAIAREVEESLKRLQTDYIDLYIIHRFDYSTPIEQTMEALHKLVVSGKVKAIGASAMYAYQFHNMQEVASKNGWTQFSSMQNHYNLLYREDERELFPVCQQFNTSLTPYSPLASGRTARVQWESKSMRSQSDKTAVAKYDSTKNEDQKIVKRIKELADKYQVTMSQISLAWHFAKGISSPIIGANKIQYLQEAVFSLDIKLTAEDIAYLEELYLPHNLVGLLPHNK